MLSTTYKSFADFGTEMPRQGGTYLSTANIVKALHGFDPGFHADIGARHGLWHPEIADKQGLFFLHKHVCSMDRGFTPQWPEWNTEANLVEVDLDYALRHEDFPVLDLLPGEEPTLEGRTHALIERPCITTVRTIGWAEVFWKVLKRVDLAGLDSAWFARTFCVSMDWLPNYPVSPVIATYRISREKGMLPTPRAKLAPRMRVCL